MTFLRTESRDIPVNAGLPNSIVEAVEDVQEHWANVSRGSPIHGHIARVRTYRLTGVVLLVSITTTPQGKGKDKQHNPRNLGTNRSANTLNINEDTGNPCSDDLGKIVQETVEGLGSGAETGTVDRVLLVDIKPIGGEKHGEQKDNEGLKTKRFPKTQKLTLPAGVLLQNDTATILSNNVASVAKHQSQDSTTEHEDNETNISAIGDSFIACNVDVLAKRNLETKEQQR